MQLFGYVHLFVEEDDFNEWRSILSRHGWDFQLYSPRDQLWQPVSPDLQECMVMDLDIMPLENVARLANYPAASPILTVANPSKLDAAIESMRCGAWDVLLRPVAIDHLVKKIAAAMERDRQVRAGDHDWRARCQALSPREHEVLHLLLDACNTAQIAHRLAISTKTAEKHRLHVLEKLNVQSVAELLRMAYGPRKRVSSSSVISGAAGDREAVPPAASAGVAVPQVDRQHLESAVGIS